MFLNYQQPKVGISDNHFLPFADFVIFACTTITQKLVENATQFTRLIIMYKQNWFVNTSTRK